MITSKTQKRNIGTICDISFQVNKEEICFGHVWIKKKHLTSNYQIFSKHVYRDKVVYANIPFSEEDHTWKITVTVPCPVGVKSR